jgi:hypothetical protein
MSFRGLLRHQLAIVTPGVPDMANLDESGFPIQGNSTYIVVKGLVQPRDAREVKSPLEEGISISDFMIFLEMQPLSAASYITYANDAGPLPGAARYQINGIMPFPYGRDPHLEVLATLIGGTMPQ